MKLRPLALAAGATLAVASVVTLALRGSSLPTPVEEMRSAAEAAARAPGGDRRPAAQNPCDHLDQLICSQTGITKDPTGTVRPDLDGEEMAIDLFRKITEAHPDYTADQVNEALAEEIYTPRNRNRLEAAFRWVKHSIGLFIDSRPESVFTPWEKKQLKHRLKLIELQLPPPVAIYADEPDLITKNDVYYERLIDGTMRLRVGGAYFFTAHSWFNTVFTLAHELAHGIDPCEVRAARLSFPAYDRLSACFMEQKLVPLKKNRFECGQKDELSETFADWIAVHVSARTLRNYSTEFHGAPIMNAVINSVRDLCDSADDPGEDDGFHPPASVRIDRIFGRNPEIREILGCETQPSYCDFDFKIGNSK